MLRKLGFLFMAALFILAPLAESQAQLNGPRYRMFFLNSSARNFDPHQDVLNPSLEEKALEELRGVITGAALQSFLPFVTSFTSSAANKPTPQDQMLLMISNLKTQLSAGLKTVAANNTMLPLTHSFMLVPNFDQRTDLFYGSEKISMSASEVVNVISMTPTHPRFDAKITQALKDVHSQDLIKTPGSELIAARTDVLVKSVDKTLVTVQVLLALDSLNTEFVEENDQVKFERLIIPENTSAPPVALLTFEFDISQNPKNPTLNVQLGAFDRYEGGKFLISDKDRNKSIPRLDGRANKTGLKFVAIQIGFTNLQFDLVQAQLTSINTITRPGLKFGKSSFVVGGFKISSVDQQFETEINKKIDAEIGKAIQNGQQAIESKLMSKEVMDLLLSKLLQ